MLGGPQQRPEEKVILNSRLISVHNTLHSLVILFHFSSILLHRIGTCVLPISPGCRKDLWLPVRLHVEHGGAEGEFEDVELHVSVSVKSPYDEDQDLNQADLCSNGASHNNNNHGNNNRDRDYFNTKPSPSAMVSVRIGFILCY